MSQPEIVTLEEARLWLRFTDDETGLDDQIQLILDAATEKALATADAYVPGDTPPAALKMAILAHTARAFETLSDCGEPETNLRLLMPLRTLGV